MGNASRRNPVANFHNAAGSGSTVFDRFGRPVVEGCSLVFNPEQPAVFTVKSIGPNLGAAEPGIYNVQLVCDVTIAVRVNTLVLPFIGIAWPQERLNEQFGGVGEEAPAPAAESPDAVAAAPAPAPDPDASAADPSAAAGPRLVLTDA